MQERTQPPSVDNLTEARRAIEAMLLVANDPTPVQLLAQLVELPVDLVQSMCRELAGEYEAERRGFQLAEVAGGWRFQTHPDTHAYVERFALEGIPNRLSSAALETLAIVAYKQPISRAQVGAIRGVNVDGVLRTLVQRGYVDEQGRDDGPGQATLFGTTPFFLEQLGLMSLDDLPPLGDFVPSVEVLEALENTLRVEPEPEIVILDDGEEGAAAPAEAEVQVEAEAGADADGSADVVDPDGQPTVDGAEEPVEVVLDDDTDPTADTSDDVEAEVEADAEVSVEADADADAAVEADVDGEAEVGADEDIEAGTGDVSAPDSIGPDLGHGANNGSTNGSSNGSSNGLATHTNGDTGDDAVYEIIADPTASVIPLATHLANSTNGTPPTEDSSDDDIESVEDAELEIDLTEVEADADAEAQVDLDLDVEAGWPPSAWEVPEPESEPEPALETEPGQAYEIEQAADAGLEPVPSDELEVTADPEVEQTDGPTETGAAGADDARFPGPGSAPPTDAPRPPASSREAGDGMGQGTPPAADRGGPAEDAAPSGPETMTNGHRPAPESGDA